MEEAPASLAIGGKIKESREQHHAIAHVPSRLYSSGFSSSNVLYVVELKKAQSRAAARMTKGRKWLECEKLLTGLGLSCLQETGEELKFVKL